MPGYGVIGTVSESVHSRPRRIVGETCSWGWIFVLISTGYKDERQSATGTD
jgi:hypothetical protein